MDDLIKSAVSAQMGHLLLIPRNKRAATRGYRRTYIHTGAALLKMYRKIASENSALETEMKKSWNHKKWKGNYPSVPWLNEHIYAAVRVLLPRSDLDGNAFKPDREKVYLQLFLISVYF